jgi:hypothetical protein
MSAGILLSLTESRVTQTTRNIIAIIHSVMYGMRAGFREFLKPSFAYYIPILLVIQ